MRTFRRRPGAGRTGARPRFTGRAAVLALVVCTLVAALAYPTRQFVAQRAQIDAQRGQADHARQRVRRLRREKARWQDPAYVRAQARERLHYALPGEVPFVSVDPGHRASADDPLTGGRAAAPQPWYASLWDSVDEADRAAPEASSSLR